MDEVILRARERPDATTLVALHRLLDLGISEVARRIAEGRPLTTFALFGNDHQRVERRLRATIDLLGHDNAELRVRSHDATSFDHTPWEVIDQTLLTHADLRSEVPLPRIDPDPPLCALVADATRRALEELGPLPRSSGQIVSLVTTGEGHAPYVALGAIGDEGPLDTEYALCVQGERYFAEAAAYLADRDPLADREHERRMASFEEALRVLDVAGTFGRGAQRAAVLLLLEHLPPEPADAGAARRLNPGGPLLDGWLETYAEGPLPPRTAAAPFAPGQPTAATTAATASPPCPALAELWRRAPGMALDDSTTIYGPDEIDERNTTYEVDRWCPGWVMVGDDGGGRGYLMRRTPLDNPPATARAAAEVIRLGMGALQADVTGAGDLVADDLVGWLGERSVEATLHP